MDIVSKLPFELQMIKKFPVEERKNAISFFENDREIWESDEATLSVEENDEIELLFRSEDKNARLYLEDWSIIPENDPALQYDSDGYLYRSPKEEPFILYKSNSGFDELCVDTFEISVLCYDKWYYGTLQVMPKQMSMHEWVMMREELEKEIEGLKKDILRKRLGFRNENSDDFSAKILYDFMLIKQYAQPVLSALLDIAERPRCEIITTYEKVSGNKNIKLDGKSMKYYLTRPRLENVYEVPVKKIHYDTKDNRFLKKMIIDYDKRLNQILNFLVEFQNQKKNALVRNDWEKNVATYEEMTRKLKKITSLLKTKEWYQKVKHVSQEPISHSFVMDTRYGTVYQLYLKLQKEDVQSNFVMDFSHIWKRSSYLYEVWCYIKVVRLLATKYEIKMQGEEKEQLFSPFKKGTTVEFYDEKVRLKLVYDKPLSRQKEGTTVDDPVYMAKGQNKMHNRPDMMLYVYDKETKWYLGSIVLECKYRKISSFWNEVHQERSSLGQLQAYYNNARSSYLCGDFGEQLNMRPVRKVLVLTPDERGNDRKQEDFHICVKSFKPSDTEIWNEGLLEEINADIKKLVDISEILIKNH